VFDPRTIEPGQGRHLAHTFSSGGQHGTRRCADLGAVSTPTPSDDDAGAIFSPRPVALRRAAPSLIDVTLDAAQRAAVERPPGDALLVLGEAGHGKTTVALHRLAHLCRRSTVPLRCAVVVPTEGLARLLQPLLRRLGVDVEAQTYDRWASRQARRAFRRLPRESESTPPSVMRLKRHPALRSAIEDMATREPGRVDDDADAHTRRRSGFVSRGDLQHLFGDRLLLERVARAGGIPARAVLDTLERTRIQFSPTTEEEWAHVTERERLVAVDRRAIDEGTASEVASSVDVEDYAVLFELDTLRANRAGRSATVRPTYDVILLDEAQELAPLELALLGRTLKEGGTLVVAGDAQQQMDETSTFLGWPAVMLELGRAGHETVTLGIGYRCPPEVVRVAHGILAGTRGEGTRMHAFDGEPSLDGWLARGVRHVQRRDRLASLAILCRSPLTARRITAALQQRECPARLVFDGRFLPRGVQVTTVEEVKGLEFDFVLVPDASAHDYPATEAARRALYVAVTRARHQVALACVGERSPAVP
jgi:superfamily I DNA/RNA helicase